NAPMEAIFCPLCNSLQTVFSFSKDNVNYHLCKSCSFRFSTPPVNFLARQRMITFLVICFSLAVTVCAYWPGSMSADSVIQLWEGRHRSFTDWHPPIMSWLMGRLDYLYPGPALMLILHDLMFWLGLGICAVDTLGHRFKTWLVIILVGFAAPITS